MQLRLMHVQGRTGHNIGKKTARGVYISGKDEDLRAELGGVSDSASRL